MAAAGRSYDFLLSVSPIDTDKAFDRFIAEGAGKPPHFHYRPLTVDPDEAKRALYDIDFRALEDPLLERLLGEKRHELDAQLTMLATRNTPAFQSASIFLYGAVSKDVLDDAKAILAAGGSVQPKGDSVGSGEIAAAAAALAATYQAIHPSFAPDELPRLLADCSVGVFPSYYEGFGFGVLEMLAAALPVLAYRVPGPPMMLPPAWLVQPRQIGGVELGGRILNLLGSPLRLAEARARARERSRRFDWLDIAQRTVRAYEEATARRGAARR